MCPSFRATLDERDSTRGRANALRLAMSGEQPLRELQDEMGPRRLRSLPDVQGVQGGVSQQRGRGQAQGGVAAILSTRAGRGRSAICSWPAFTVSTASARRWRRSVNWLQNQRPLRWLLEKTAGIDRRRSLPPLHAGHFRRWFARHKPDAAAGRRRPRAVAGRLLHHLQRAGRSAGRPCACWSAPATPSSWPTCTAAAGR